MTQDESVFIWSHFDKWSPVVIHWLEEVIPIESWDEARQDPRMYFHSMRSNATCHSIGDPCTDTRIDVATQLSRKFRDAYSKIRLFHACRPTDIGSYLRSGLLPLAPEAVNERARTLFLSGKFPAVTERALSDAVAELSRENRGGYIYLSLDDIDLARHAGHYLIYGSEYLAVLAKSLSRRTGEKCLEILRTIGIPTVFVCDVPLDYLSESNIQSLVQELIYRAIFERRCPNGTDHTIDFTFTLCTRLPASVITSHYHPTKIPDPLNRANYIHPKVSCAFCATSGKAESC